jgi:hypothetical protein
MNATKIPFFCSCSYALFQMNATKIPFFSVMLLCIIPNEDGRISRVYTQTIFQRYHNKDEDLEFPVLRCHNTRARRNVDGDMSTRRKRKAKKNQMAELDNDDGGGKGEVRRGRLWTLTVAFERLGQRWSDGDKDQKNEEGGGGGGGGNGFRRRHGAAALALIRVLRTLFSTVLERSEEIKQMKNTQN